MEIGNNSKIKTISMKKMKNIMLMAVSLILLSSCENEGFYYQDTARIRLEGAYEWALGTDSLEFSFVTAPSSVLEKDIEVTVYIMGEASKENRVANIQIISTKTTATSDLYECPSQVIIPANSYSAKFNVTLKRDDVLQEKTVRLYLQVGPSSDFQSGVAEYDHLLVKWNDVISEPKNWSELKSYFGTFSVVKFRFMLNTLGVSEFDTTTLTWAQLQNYKIVLLSALKEYNENHPEAPLTDEKGVLVTF